MAETIAIPRGNWESPGPCWIDAADIRGAEKMTKPFIKCKCGALCRIDNHHLHEDGSVTASFLHIKGGASSKQDCGWHVFLRLKEWYGGEIKSGVA